MANVERARRLLSRARAQREGFSELRAKAVRIVGGARLDGLDPGCVRSVIAAAYNLGTGSVIIYRAGSKHDRDESEGFGSDEAFLDAAGILISDINDKLRSIEHLQGKIDQAQMHEEADLEQAFEALARAQAALARARAMPVKNPCRGCHVARSMAIAAAQRRIAAARHRIRQCEHALRILEHATEVLSPLSARLRAAAGNLAEVREDLSVTYEGAYTDVAAGRLLPVQGRWIEGEGAAGAG